MCHKNSQQILYGMFDWSVITQSSPFIAALVSERGNKSVSVAKSSGRSSAVNVRIDMSALQQISDEEKMELLLKVTTSVVAKVLSIEESEIDESLCLVNLGMESQKATEFIQIMYDTTGCRIPVAYLISPEYTIKMVIDFMLKNIGKNAEKNIEELQQKEQVEDSLSFMENLFVETGGILRKSQVMWFSVDFKLSPGFS